MENKERGMCPDCNGIVVEKIYSKYDPTPPMHEPKFECTSCKKKFDKFPPLSEDEK
jgi:uncharacterized protein with PIN domain